MDRLCVGVIVGAQGVKGAVRIKHFTERATDLAAYGPVEDEAGLRRFHLKTVGFGKGVVLAMLEGVASRDDAEGLKGVRLFVPRAALPAVAEDEFYYSDLVGLTAILADGRELGKVKAVFDFGGGDIIEVVGPGGAVMLPFTRAVVPMIDLAAGRLIVEPPQEVSAGTEGADGD